MAPFWAGHWAACEFATVVSREANTFTRTPATISATLSALRMRASCAALPRIDSRTALFGALWHRSHRARKFYTSLAGGGGESGVFYRKLGVFTGAHVAAQM